LAQAICDQARSNCKYVVSFCWAMSSSFSTTPSSPNGGHRIAVSLAFFFCAAGATSAQLPYVQVQEGGAQGGLSFLEIAHTDHNAWWTQVGDRMYHAPSEDSGLSRNIEDYYVTLGSTAAMPEEMKAHYVGGQGRWNILHLPEGPSRLEVPSNMDRRSAFSSLAQLENGAVLSNTTFPIFELDPDYSSGLDKITSQKERNAVATITPEAVQQTLTELVALPTRSWEDKSAQQHAIDFVKGKFEELGLPTGLHQFTADGSGEVPVGDIETNVVACVPGQSSDSVTIGAHYDSRPYEGAAPGAEDNGSGLAVMLNIARAFSKAKVTPVKTVYFVGFAAEEPGLLGSAAFVKELMAGGRKFPVECRPSKIAGGSFLKPHWRDKGKAGRHKAIVLDEVGWPSPYLEKMTINLESFDWTNHDVMQHMGQASKQYNPEVEVVHNNAPFGSDHMSFLDKQMPAVLAINGDDEAYPNYHKSTDTIDNVNFMYASSFGKMCLAALMRMSCV